MKWDDELLEKFNKLLFLQEHPVESAEDYIDENGNMALSEYSRWKQEQRKREMGVRENEMEVRKREEVTAKFIVAVSKGRVEVVKALLQAGADVNAKLNDGHIALMYAAQEGHTGIVKILEEKEGIL
jgi:uncharacterized protein